MPEYASPNYADLVPRPKPTRAEPWEYQSPM